jgi:TolA-binding protein
MNGDYNNAAEFYLLALAVRPEALESIFLRVAIASIRAGRLDDALRYIDEMPIGNLAGAEKRWQAEWNIAHALILEKRAEEAIERIQQLNTNQAELSSSLNLRMRWLELNLAIDLKKVPLDASLQVDQLIAQLSDVLLASNGSLEVDAEIEVLAAELLFLKARIAYLDDGIESADASLLELRQNYNASMAAQRSYLLEAAELERRGQLEEAQVAMLNLADKYPESSLAPQSIFEAALICERRGVDHYVETVQLYERLTDRFPDDVLVYRARLRQGDLLRLLNDFAGARLIYETLANTYPEHPLRHFSELSRAQCMLALAKKDPAKLAKAGSVLERLVDLPDLDLNFRVEAMFKWAFALEGQGAKDQARAVLTQSVARNLLDIKSASALNSTGRYWAARTLLELGERLSSRDEFEEAKTIYHKLIAYNLPGRGLAQSRINSIRINNN